MNDKLTSVQIRLNNIKNLLTDANLESINPIYNATENTDTDFFSGKQQMKENKSCDSRIVLCKRDLDFYKVMGKLKCNLVYVKSGAYGSTFKGIVFDKSSKEEKIKYTFALKVVAYNKSDKYGSINDLTRPENAEICMLKLLSYFVIKNLTPHIMLPISTFNCNIKPFLTLQEEGLIDINNAKYKEFVDDYNKGCFHDKVSILMSEWADRNDLGMFLKKNYKKLNIIHWKTILFQIILTLAQIQLKYLQFRHNDLKANNILINQISPALYTSMIYRINNMEFRVPNIGYSIYLWDFDFACIPNVIENKKIYRAWASNFNITPVQNRYYDIHYFFCTLLFKGFLPELLTDTNVPKELIDFINYVLPTEFRPIVKNSKKDEQKILPSQKTSDRCRLIVDEEYLLPIDILKHNFFSVFMVSEKK